MEDSALYISRPKLDGNKTEVYRIYYDKNITSFDEFLLIEHFALVKASQKKWKIFHAFPSLELGAFMVCKN